MSNSTYTEMEEDDREYCCDEHPEAKEGKATPDNFKYNVGDIIKVRDPNMNLMSPANPDEQYHGNLQVAFRFFNGNHVYVVEDEDRMGLIVFESDIELVDTASNKPSGDAPAPVSSHVIGEDIYKALCRLGILDTSVRSYNRGASDYSQHIIQPWSIWLDYNLNPWDADIVKRILRTKEGDSRRLDYEKIIHICEERIRQIDMED